MGQPLIHWWSNRYNKIVWDGTVWVETVFFIDASTVIKKPIGMGHYELTQSLIQKRFSWYNEAVWDGTVLVETVFGQSLSYRHSNRYIKFFEMKLCELRQSFFDWRFNRSVTKTSEMGFFELGQLIFDRRSSWYPLNYLKWDISSWDS